MDALTFLKADRDRAREVAEMAGSNIDYFVQIAYGHRRPSFRLAEKLVEASGDQLDLLLLLKAKEARTKRAA